MRGPNGAVFLGHSGTYTAVSKCKCVNVSVNLYNANSSQVK